jgi:NCS1 family nucleobase:cation symporter-1
VPLAAIRIYDMSFFTGFGVSALVYYVANFISPVPGKASSFEEVDLSAEEAVEQIHHSDTKLSSDASTDEKV